MLRYRSEWACACEKTGSETKWVGRYNTTHFDKPNLCLLLCLLCFIWNGSSVPDDKSNSVEDPACLKQSYDILRNAKFYWNMQGEQVVSMDQFNDLKCSHVIVM